MAFCLVDTNVMLGASAYLPTTALSGRAMPLEWDLREKLFNWLSQFDLSDDILLLDEDGLVRAEYDRNIPWHHPDQEYGLQVIQAKLDRDLVRYVAIRVRDGDGERVADLDPEHARIVTDREDRKWVACALASPIRHQEDAPIFYGAESDWWLIREELRSIGVNVVNLLPESWYTRE